MGKNFTVALLISAVLLLAGIVWRATQPAYDHARDVVKQEALREQKDIDLVSRESLRIYVKGIDDYRYTVVKVIPDGVLGLDRVAIKSQRDRIRSVPVKPGLKMVVGEQVCVGRFVYNLGTDFGSDIEEIKFAVPAADVTPKVGK